MQRRGLARVGRAVFTQQDTDTVRHWRGPESLGRRHRHASLSLQVPRFPLLCDPEHLSTRVSLFSVITASPGGVRCSWFRRAEPVVGGSDIGPWPLRASCQECGVMSKRIRPPWAERGPEAAQDMCAATTLLSASCTRHTPNSGMKSQLTYN